MSDTVVLTVINPVEGKRYRVSLRGDISRVSVRKLKRHLAPSVQINEADQMLKYGGVELSDDVLCAEVGITHGSTITVERISGAGGGGANLFSPRKEALEMETLEQQRAMLQQERMLRDDEFRRQQDLLARSITQAEQKRLELQREKDDRELELQRLQEMEQMAEAERRRLADVRRLEAEREAARARDLEQRKEQLTKERQMQRQLEITKLENERKKMLLAQQRSELEAERARLDREIRDRIQRQREAEMRIREREVELERIAIDGERAKREIELERAVLRQTRDAEVALMNAERDQEMKRLQHLQSQAALLTSASMARTQSPPRASNNGSIIDTFNNSPLSGGNTNNSPGRKATTGLNASGRTAAVGAAGGGSSSDNSSNALRNIENRLMEIERSRGAGVPRGASPPRGADGEAAGTQTLTQVQLRRIAQANLDILAQHLGVGELLLDDNHTCVVSVDDKYTLLITIDISTQRLYLYSTLSTHVPRSPNIKLRLYEFLLEGALLGRDMCGGGVGLSLKNDFVLMSTSIFLPLAAPTALRAITPRFVEALVTWRARVQEILAEGGEESVASGPTAYQPQYPQQQQQQYFAPQQQQQHQQQQQQIAERPVVGIEVTEQGMDMYSATPRSASFGQQQQQQQNGVLVVAAKGPAARGGVLAGDVIRAVNGIATPDLDEFQRAVQLLRPNSTAHFVVNRLGADVSLTVLVGSAPL